jgi:hypothetical protein
MGRPDLGGIYERRYRASVPLPGGLSVVAIARRPLSEGMAGS